jgi:hypothetical protein
MTGASPTDGAMAPASGEGITVGIRQALRGTREICETTVVESANIMAIDEIHTQKWWGSRPASKSTRRSLRYWPTFAEKATKTGSSLFLVAGHSLALKPCCQCLSQKNHMLWYTSES